MTPNFNGRVRTHDSNGNPQHSPRRPLAARSGLVRSLLAAALVVTMLHPVRAAAQTTGELEAFRERLATFLRELEEVHVLTGIHPAGEPGPAESAAPDLATLSYDDLAKLMQSYPNDPRFWEAPRKLLEILKRVNPNGSHTSGIAFPLQRGRDVRAVAARWPDRSARRSKLSDEDVSILMRAYSTNRPAHQAPQAVLAALHQSYRVNDDLFGRLDDLDIVRRTPATRRPAPTASAGVTLTTAVSAEAAADPVACPAGFDYEALWIARDAEMVADIAMEIIPEDALTSPAYIVAAVAWGALKVTLFAVEQVYERWDDCESANVFAQVDASISSRATQASVDALQSGLSSIQSAVSEIPAAFAVEAASMEAGLTAFQAVVGSQSVQTLATINALMGRVDNLAAASATSSAVNQLSAQVAGSGETVNQVSAMVSAAIPRKRGPSGPITVYTEPNFGGASKVFQGDEGSTLECIGAPFLQFFFGIKSVRVPAGTTVTFYAACHFQGDSRTFTADDGDLSGDKLQINPGWMEFPAASMRIVQTEQASLEVLASQASLDTLNSKVDALDLSGAGALASKIDAVQAAVADVQRDLTARADAIGVALATRASQASVDQLSATLATRASQGSVDVAAASILAALQQRFDDLASRVAAQPLQLQIAGLSKDRFLVYVTDAGHAAGGATVAKVQALDRHPRGGASVTDITGSVTATEIAPGMLEVRVPRRERLDGVIVSVSYGQGAALRAASTVVGELKGEQ